MKKFFTIVIGLVLLVLLVVVAFVATFDANNYKDQIIQQVEQQTGRDFKIDGDINLSVFPWVGLKVEKVALGNARGFSARAFAEISQLDVKVMVLPLLKKEVHVDKVSLHGLSVSLEIDDMGRNNWSDMSQPSVTDSVDAAAPGKTSAGSGAGLAGMIVNGIELLNAKVNWSDAQTGTEVMVSELSLKTDAVQPEQPINVTLNAHVLANQPVADAKISLQTEATFNEALTVFKANALKLKIQSVIKSVSNEAITLDFKTDAFVNLAQQTAGVQSIEASVLGAVMNANFNITQLDTEPRIRGFLSTNAFNGRDIARQLKIELPPMANANSLGRISFEGQVDAQASNARIDKLKIALDQSQVVGWVNVIDVAQPSVNYKLNMSSINLDDYMAPVPDANKQETDQQRRVDDESAGANADVEIPLPVDLLRTLGLSGTYEIESATLNNIEIKDISIKTQAGSGLMRIRPVTMNLLDGQIEAGVDLDVREVPAYSIAVTANKLDAGPIIDPMLKGMTGDEEVKVSGDVEFTADIKARGGSLMALKKTATGNINFDMKQTLVTGVDVEYFARNAVIDYLERGDGGLPAEWRGEYTPKEKTAYKKIHASFVLAQGKLKNNDFIMDSRPIKVTGNGEIDIVNNAMDYYALIDLELDRNKTVADKLLNEPMGVRIHGPFESLEKDIDKKRLANAAKDLGAAKVKKEVNKKVEEKKQKAVDKIEDKLKSLFR